MASLLANLLLVALAAAAQATQPQTTGRVMGRVLDAQTGEPVVGVRVTLVSAPVIQRSAAGTVLPRPMPPIAPLTTETNADGVFDMTGVPSGRWRLNAQKTGYVTFNPSQSAVDVPGGAITLPDIRLDRGGVIAGRVLDAKGNALGGTMIQAVQMVRLPDGSVHPATTLISTQTNDLGEFRLSGLPPGQHYVAAQMRPSGPIGSPAPAPAAVTYVTTYYPGFTEPSAASPVNVARGLTTNGIEFSMRPVAAYQVSGVVVDSEGRGVAGAAVQLMEVGGLGPISPRQATSANDGTFRVVNVPAGIYRALAAIPIIIRSGNVQSISVSFAAPLNAGVEIVVHAADVSGLRVPVIQK